MTTCPNCGRACRGTCRICCVTRSREQMRERGRKWRARNPERSKQIVHDHYLAHKARKRELAKQWRKENPEKSADSCRRWREMNPEKYAAQKERARVAEILRAVEAAKKRPAREVPKAVALRKRAEARAQGIMYGYTGGINVERR